MAERGTPSAEWIPIAQKFPVTLNKDTAPEAIGDNESQDSFGIGLDKPNYLYVAPSVSVGTAWTGIATVSAPTYPPATCTWRMAHNRMWGWVTSAGSSTLYYGAYGYDSTYLIQNLGYIPCDYESSVITQVVPFGNNVAVFKGDFLYVVRNADSPSGSFVAEFVKQATGCPVAGNVIVIDDVLVWVNTHGIFACNGQNITELTLPIRNNLGTFVSTAITSLTADFEKRRVIGLNTTGKFIIELGDKPMLYDYSTVGFRFTSKTLVSEDASPLLIDKVGIVYQFNAADSANITLQIKINDTWKTEPAFTIRPATDNGFVEIPLTNYLACRKFALRITALSESFYINSISVHVKTGGVRGYSNK
jgi:hypothetical protein